MKKVILLALALLLTLSAAALADDMLVVNCKEWVSLRETPSTSARRLKQVPLGEVVTDCAWDDSHFIRCTYDGATGYILEDYLEPLEPDEPDTVISDDVGGVIIQALRQYNDGEKLTVTCYDADEAELWSYVTRVPDPTELDLTDAFIGGTADAPCVVVFNADEGLRALDIATGATLWTLDNAEVRFSGSLNHAVDADGTMYITGYYGPDPVCVDVNGRVVWRASAGSDDIYWPYDIAIEDRGIVTRYESMDSDDATDGSVIYDRADGHLIEVVYN